MNSKRFEPGGQPPRFDLHIHTTASDGTDSPEAVVALAAGKGFSIIAITDHDTMCGVPEAVAAGEKYGVRVIGGVEISAGGQTEVHVLGYGVRDVERLEQTLTLMRDKRAERMAGMVEKLRALGVDVTLDEVTALSGGSVGRSHLARVLIDKGVVRDVREAFAKYLSPGKPAYVEREKLGVQQAVRLIADCGGLPVIAHPGQNRGESYWGRERFHALKAYGLRGIEVYHMAHGAAQAAAFERIARAENLLVTGGSDYHGKVKNVGIGDGMQHWRRRGEDLRRFLKALGD
ncbi:MAG: PHP domain-containing protein [Clostridiales bacterium]|nr:PHP domain-containing protein [Clostridiales bacterium]MDD7368029.1 PHP domain-containing protein [Clostridiales bacterium]